MAEAFFSVGFLAGLLGFAHCAGMCGGLSAAFAMQRPGASGLVFLLCYQAGRIFTYTALGWAGATLGAAALITPWFAQFSRWVMIGSDLLVILLGLGGLGVIPFLALPEGVPGVMGGPLGKVSRLVSSLPSPAAGTALGLLFGFIPCGLLYPILLGAALTAEPAKGAITMLGFGLGTAPALLVMGTAAMRFRKAAQKLMPLAWIMVIGLGLWNLYVHLTSPTGCCP